MPNSCSVADRSRHRRSEVVLCFQLNNGCICCKVRGDLIRTLTKLVKRKNKVDGILIETTGLADPGPVIQTFFTGTHCAFHPHSNHPDCSTNSWHSEKQLRSLH